MKLNFNNFKKKLKNYNCFDKNPHCAVAVSGGPDSILLTMLLKKWINEINGRLTAIIIDHNVRKNSKDESIEVKNYLKKIKIHSKIIKLTHFKNYSFSMNYLRERRYKSLTSFCKKNNILHLFLGHQLDDNIETYIGRRIAGSNIEGLRGINELVVLNKILLIRPLLNFRKKQIYNFLNNENIKFIEDPTNTNYNYTRSIIRKSIKNNRNFSLFNNEFNKMKKIIPLYFYSVMKILIENSIKVNKSEIIINYDTFNVYDDLLIERVISSIYSFFFGQKIRVKSKKIQLMIKNIRLNQISKQNLKSLIINRNKNLLEFSPKRS